MSSPIKQSKLLNEQIAKLKMYINVFCFLLIRYMY